MAVTLYRKGSIREGLPKTAPSFSILEAMKVDLFSRPSPIRATDAFDQDVKVKRLLSLTED